MRRLAAVAFAALVFVAPAQAAAPRFWSLPSPLAPLSASPPLGGGARASGEGRPHRVGATTHVRVKIDASGRPFAVTAIQRLAVSRLGDYAFQIGAPAVDARAAAGSQSEPGLRTGAVLWQGFTPGRRVLAAVVDLEPSAAATSLPLEVEIDGDRLVLHNATTVKIATFTAEALAPQLEQYIASLRDAAERGVPPTGGGALVTSTLKPRSVEVSAPLRITGSVGSRHVTLVLGGATHPLTATLPRGRVRLQVTPLPPLELLAPKHETGRALLDRATHASLEFARSRQFDAFLGNPDPGGASSTDYVYVSGRPASAAPGENSPRVAGHRWVRSLLIAVVALATAAAAAVAWARS
jgi:hypothetical protein